MTSGEYISSMKARGIGAKPGLFLNDSTRVVSIQEKCVLVREPSAGVLPRTKMLVSVTSCLLFSVVGQQ